jgi:hypothetical protein
MGSAGARRRGKWFSYSGQFAIDFEGPSVPGFLSVVSSPAMASGRKTVKASLSMPLQGRTVASTFAWSSLARALLVIAGPTAL